MTSKLCKQVTEQGLLMVNILITVAGVFKQFCNTALREISLSDFSDLFQLLGAANWIEDWPNEV